MSINRNIKRVNMNSGDLLGPVLDNRVRKVVEEHWLESQLEKKEIKSLKIEQKQNPTDMIGWLLQTVVWSVET